MLFVLLDGLDRIPLSNVFYFNLYTYKFMLNNENFFSAALNPESSSMYGTLYINPLLKISLDLQAGSRIRKPSKRKEGVDPLLPITPARPPLTFASRRIQGSQNRAAAAVLFTPRARKQHHGPVPLTANQYPPPSPTPQRALRAQSPFKSTLASNNSSSDTEEEVRIELEKLDLHSQSGSQSQSGSRSRSGSQSPRAGPHSTQRKAQRPKGGANDVWKFFEKSSECSTCVFCKYVLFSLLAMQIFDFNLL
jgi:hypothetical protein